MGYVVLLPRLPQKRAVGHAGGHEEPLAGGKFVELINALGVKSGLGQRGALVVALRRKPSPA